MEWYALPPFTYTNYQSFPWHQTRLNCSRCSCQLRASSLYEYWIPSLKTSTNRWVTWLEIFFLLWKREFFVWCLLLLVVEQTSEESDFIPTNNCVVAKKSSLDSSRIHENHFITRKTVWPNLLKFNDAIKTPIANLNHPPCQLTFCLCFIIYI